MPNPPVKRSQRSTVDISEVHSNVNQEIIEITSDKLKLILMNHVQSVSSRKEWQNPLSICLTIILVLCTTDFKATWNVSADSWHAIFIVASFLSFLWLIKALVSMKTASTIDNILDATKNKN